MRVLSDEYLDKITKDIFEACGTPAPEAEALADHLVSANLMGFDSHGVIRVPQYVDDIQKGFIVPGAPINILNETTTTAILDVGWNFGQLGALRATEVAIRKAKADALGCVVIRRCRHVGRVGAYPQLAAERNLIGMAMCSGGWECHTVCPWGGRERRMAPNPIAFSVPTDGTPFVMDFSTSVAAEGKIRLMRNQGKNLPEGWLLDGKGCPSTDPNDLYASSPGAILPFGGTQGYKGFALALMAQILSSLLGNPAWRKEGKEAYANLMWFLAIDISAFMPPDEFRREADALIAYMKSSALAEGFDQILVPGELEFREMEKRKADGIPVDEETWRQIEKVATELGVDL